MDHFQNIKRKYEAISSCLNEKGHRLWAAAESLSYDYGGISLVSRATGLSRTTIHKESKKFKIHQTMLKRSVSLVEAVKNILKNSLI